ncbi:hypothetical protein KUTeg_024442, partial [Tegillarca granosa]
MVEGPGCKIKGEKIKGRLIGRVVKAVSGNAVDREIKPSKGIDVSQFHQLVGLKLDDVQTLGKELFMYFGEICLRVHFLMAGSFTVNGQKLDKDFGGNAETASLELQMGPDKLSFMKSSVLIRSSESCYKKYEELNDLDICSPKFNHKRAVALVIEQKGRQLCDVLLDQEILPGVGNIIKNEALFDSGIKPSSKVEELNQEHCRKTGKPLNKYMKIYKKGKCTQCQGKVTICRLGDDNERVTYFCNQCQNNDLKSNQKRTLPVKNSLLGWVQTGSSEEKEEWTCTVCTLINTPNCVNCVVCASPKLPLENDNTTATMMSRKQENFQSTDKHLTTEPQSITRTSPSIKTENSADRVRHPAKRKSHVPPLEPLPPSSKKTRMEESNDSGVTTKIPSCPGHNKKCSLVEWADESFPICMGHGKPCTIRTVMKQGPNNGKKFFTCSQPKNKQCQYFEWA